MELRGVDRQAICDALDVSEGALSRWINGLRTPRAAEMRALEDFLQIEPGDLFRDPEKAAESGLLAGLGAAERDEAKRFIAFLHSRKK
jgi:transcriptional regulator with XRE-family HTH domain